MKIKIALSLCTVLLALVLVGAPHVTAEDGNQFDALYYTSVLVYTCDPYGLSSFLDVYAEPVYAPTVRSYGWDSLYLSRMFDVFLCEGSPVLSFYDNSGRAAAIMLILDWVQ